MATREELERQIAHLETRLASGVRSIRDQNGEQVDYMSATDMQRALARLRRELVGKPPPLNSIRFNMTKGL